MVRREPDDHGQPSLIFEDLEVREGDALEEEIDAFVQAVARTAAAAGDGLGRAARARGRRT